MNNTCLVRRSLGKMNFIFLRVLFILWNSAEEKTFRLLVITALCEELLKVTVLSKKLHIFE